MRTGWLAVALALWALLVGIVALGLYPLAPATARGWLALLVVAPPVYVALELFVAGSRAGRAGVRPSPAHWPRVLAVLLAFVALALLLVAALSF